MPDKKITIYIDNQAYQADKDETVLQVAIRERIDIPHLCYHEDLPIDANCRTCLVEVGHQGEIVTSCTLKVKEGLKVFTNTKQVKILSQENLELILADHQQHCTRCQQGYFCKTAELMKKYGISGTKYQKPAKDKKVFQMAQAAECDPEACILCNKCVEICERIGIGYLKIVGKGSKTHLDYNRSPDVDCIYCGQCTVHCPVTAAREQSHLKEVETALKDPEKIVIAQMAPSVRASIGEEFGLEPGINLEKQLYTAFRKLGFDQVFDVNMGADITTWVEAEELVDRLKNNGVLPMFTSCCPGWVKFVEFYYPEMIPHLTTARSPQIHSGGAYKSWWAAKEGIDPKKIVVVSFMPCTSKKYEARHEKLNIDGLRPVDYVLTTRETAVLLKKQQIDLPKLKPSSVDSAGTYSGAGLIYGASGGVMESALRTAYQRMTGKESSKVEFKEVRGFEGFRKAEISINDRLVKVAVVNMAVNARKIIEEIKRNPKAYDYIEVMACPGGCIGGGGQPIPSTDAIIKKRIAGLYKIDDQMSLRKAHLNPVVQDYMNYVKTLPTEKQHQLLHTHYRKRKKGE